MLTLKRLREEKEMTQAELGKALEISPSAIGMYEQGRRTPDIPTLKKIASYFNVSLDYLLGNSPAKAAQQQSAGRGVRIPVLGRVVAGIPLDAIEEIIDYEEIPKSMAATGEFFALQVKGDSMLPTLKNGDVVIVKKQPTVDSGDIAIILVNGNEATVKEVKESPGGITLIGHNVAVYTPQFYSNEEIKSLPVQVLGKVVEMRRKF